ncbi:MAG: FIST C-terminal domain-containing protein [Chloroflexi bacterium]|nr:FIST C-terminal domain-containing protein [Chloroflexota bacterium]
MQWSSTVSEQFSLRDAVSEAAGRIKADLGNEPPDLAVIFASPHHAPDYDDVPKLIQAALRPKVLIGCSGGGVIGGAHEVEDRIGLSITAARLPGVEMSTFHIEETGLPDMDASPAAWEKVVGVAPDKKPDFVLLVDPFSVRADALVSGLDYAFAGRAKVGGLASGANEPGGNALFLGEQTHRAGVVGAALSGNVRVETIVAQGCRPIGESMIVTKCHQNVLLELDGQKPMEALRKVFESASDRDRHLVNTALHLGIVTDPLKEQFKPGDFLIRNVLGLHRESGGMVIGEMLSEGQVVQFHVRDAQTAAEDLRGMLRQFVATPSGAHRSGALLFSCLGRGKHLFGQEDHDTGLFVKEVGALPLGGFFCNGEIGPVGASTFLHGFTSSFGIFSPKA